MFGRPGKPVRRSASSPRASSTTWTRSKKTKNRIFQEQNLTGRAAFKALAKSQQDAIERLKLSALPEGQRDEARLAALQNDPLVDFAILDSLANVFCPACKLWNTGWGANMMREAVSLMGGYGVTEDCPGFLGQKWMDAQLEATYEGPEAVQRLQMSVTMTNELFLAQFQQWIVDLRRIASDRPGTGACTLATAMQTWLWTLQHLQEATDADGAKLYHKSRQSVTFPLADALCWLLAARQFTLDVLELEAKGPANPALADALPGLVMFYRDLCQVQSARAASETGRICAELVFGYNAHPAWTSDSCRACYAADDLDGLEGVIPGIASTARSLSDVAERGEAHPAKAGPCAAVAGLEDFVHLRVKLDGCLTGARLAKDRVAEALTKVMIPEALDYPM